MDRDQLVLLVVLGFPVMLALIVFPMAIAVRRGNAFCCPNCRKRIPTTEIRTEGVRCPHCDWSLESTAESVPDQAGRHELE